MRPGAGDLALYLVGARWICGRRAEGDAAAGGITLDDPGHYVGTLQMQRSATMRGGVDLNVQRVVMPLDALMSLRTLTFHHVSSGNALPGLSPRERKEISDAYAAYLEMLATVRREVSPVAAAANGIVLTGDGR